MALWRVARALAAFILLPVLASAAGRGQDAAAGPANRYPPAWLEPIEPFRVIGPIHYVGSRGLGAYFIPTPRGHVLIDGGLPANAPMIAASIRALGYRPEEVAILLNTHAHFDHSGGLAELKRITGAELLASEGDRSALEGGFYLGSESEHRLDAPPVAVHRTIRDGEVVALGDLRLTARITPGHTRGCTSWTTTVREGDRDLDVLLFCSASVALNRLAGPPQYEGIVADYRSTFATTRSWRPDVLLGNHEEFFGMMEKRARLLAGDRLAFVDQEAFPSLIAGMEADFEREPARQQGTP
jgi:metallo-beta-lactamase class B